jgi:predicted permease
MEQDLETELQVHCEREIAKLVARGHSTAEAERLARLTIGGIDQIKEETRDAWGVRLVESAIQDAAFALRGLRKTPGFVAAVTLSLALGIGANTAIFTLMDAVMWRLLPVKDPAHLLVVGRQRGDTIETGFNYQQFRSLADHNAVAELAGYTTAPIGIAVDASPEPSVRGHLVTGNYFALLGVGTALGRTIGAEDDRVPNGHPVVVLSHGYWERRFASDPGAIGRTIRLSATPFTIIGIAPPGFVGVERGEAADIFVPIMMQPTVMAAFENLLENPINSRPWVEVIARNRPHATAQQAAAAMDAVFQNDSPGSDDRNHSGSDPAERLVLKPATTVSDLRRQLSTPLFALLAIVGVVLLIACANTANLLLARAAARRTELAMRIALGAGRSRLIRQLLVEGLLLAGLGGVCGILLARWATQLLLAYMSSGRTPISLELSPNPRILLFTCAVTAATGLLFGLAPAWRATRVDLVPALKGVRETRIRSLRPDRLLAIAQIVLSLVLLVGAALFTQSLRHLNGDDPNGIRQSVVVLRMEPKGSDQRNVRGTSERLDRIYRELIRRAGELPGVRSASMGQITPTAPTPGAGTAIRLLSGEQVRVPQVMVYPRYFSTVGIPLVSGREFGPGDLTADAPAVCIVNESFARQVFGAENPIGKTCMIDRRPRLLGFAGDRPEEPYFVVGLVKDSPYNNPHGESRPLIYTTFLQTRTGRGQMVLHVRAEGNPGPLAQRIREQVAAVDPTAPVFDVHTLQEEMNAALVQYRLIAMLSSLFGVLALLLACVGLYGLLAFIVVQRRSELGLRMALGAQRVDVAWMVVKDALRLVGIGIAIGVPAALAVARVAESRVSGLLFGVEATDPTTIAAATLVLTVITAAAAYLPARRAACLDPMLVLRSE